MKRILFICTLLLCTTAMQAQITDTFDNNKFGWQEFSQKSGSAIIEDGVLKLIGKNPIEDLLTIKPASIITSSCYGPIDPRSNFEIKCTAIAKKINDKGYFGIIFDYKDDSNYSAFFICKGEKNARVVYQKIEKNEIAGQRSSEMKLSSKRKAEFDFSIKSTFNDIKFICNDMTVMEIRHHSPQYSGFGFLVIGQQEVDFDNVEFIQ